ncbi:MAG: antitoxin VapB family protein [Candidatus Helarchaeota archaeon]
MFKYICMTTKTITIKKEVYDLLCSIKKEDESFSDLLERLAKRNKSLIILKKLKGTIDLGDSQELINEIRSKRNDWRL